MLAAAMFDPHRARALAAGCLSLAALLAGCREVPSRAAAGDAAADRGPPRLDGSPSGDGVPARVDGGGAAPDGAGAADGALRDGGPPALAVYPPLPGDAYRSAYYEVRVRQAGVAHDAYVFQSDNDHGTDPPPWDVAFDLQHMTAANHFATFSFAGAVTVEVTLRAGAPATSVASATVRPRSRGVAASASGKTVTFTLARPANLYVEIPGMDRHPLFIFASPVETNVPSAGDPQVIYFGPGLHDAGQVTVPSGVTVYLAGGAYVRGRLYSGGDRIAVRGRGVLSGVQWSTQSPWDYHHIYFDNPAAQQLSVEGIVLTDGAKYCVYTYGRIAVDNLKCLAWHVETDGFSATGAGSTLSNSFFKINDDVIKLLGSGQRISHNVIWWQIGGSAIQLSWNSIDDVSDVSVTDTDIIAADRPAVGTVDDWYQSVVGCQNLEGARYSAIAISDLRLEARPFQLFGVRVRGTRPGYDQGLGGIDGLTLRNFSMPAAPQIASVFDGNGSADGCIRNVTFESIDFGGAPMPADHVLRRNCTDGFTFK